MKLQVPDNSPLQSLQIASPQQLMLASSSKQSVKDSVHARCKSATTATAMAYASSALFAFCSFCPAGFVSVVWCDSEGC